MHIVRRGLLGIAASFLVLFLFATAIDVGIIRLLGKPDHIKQILSDSGIYDSLVSSTLDEAEKVSSGSGEIALSDPIIRTAAQNTFTPQFLQSSVNQVIDSVYDWLDGKSALPEFVIDLSSAKTTFAAEATKAAQQRLSTLPTCTSSVSLPFDALKATCLPPGLNPAQAAADVQATLLGGEGFLEDTVLTANDVKSGDSNVSLFADQLKEVPGAYQKIKVTPWVLGILSLLMLLAVIFLSSTRRKGLRRSGFVLLGVGLFLIFLALASNKAVASVVLPEIKFANAALQDDVRDLVRDTISIPNDTFLIFGSAYAALGMLTVGGTYLIGRQRISGEASEPKHRETEKSPAELSPEPSKQKSQQKPPAVQKPQEKTKAVRKIKVQ